MSVCWNTSHVGIQGNEHPDFTAKEASRHASLTDHILFGDFVNCIKHVAYSIKSDKIAAEMQSTINSAPIKETVLPMDSSCRSNYHEKFFLFRLRLGYTWVTQGHVIS